MTPTATSSTSSPPSPQRPSKSSHADATHRRSNGSPETPGLPVDAAAQSGSATGRAHRNAPLTPEGRLRLCLRIDAGPPIAHVAAEAGISRRCLAKWYARRRAHGENGLLDRSSRPTTSPARTSEDIADLVEALRRQTKHGPPRLAADLQRLHGITLAPATVHRILVRRGPNRVGDPVHVDIKKLGRIPHGGPAGRSATTSTRPSSPWPARSSAGADRSQFSAATRRRPATFGGLRSATPAAPDGAASAGRRSIRPRETGGGTRRRWSEPRPQVRGVGGA
ncbi:helix-turn-helix domain-containing protein [Streptomyces griseoruber]|uniref:helix-turn-helix domain-containing protein n=1 Tax=Streptomyces griseoruber TaxID=1943 RepID=UPI00099EF5FD